MHFRFQTLTALAAVLTIAITVPAQSGNLDVSLKADLDRHEVRLGDKARLTVTVEWTGSPSDYDVSTTSPPALIGLKLAGSESRLSAKSGPDSPVKRTMVYDLIATEAGAGKIGAIELAVKDLKNDKTSKLSTEPFEINVLPSHNPFMNLSPNARHYAAGGVLILLAVLAAVGGVIMMKRNKKVRDKPASAPALELDPESAFENSCSEAKGLLFAGNVSGYVGALESALVCWMETRLEIPRAKWPGAAADILKEKESLSPENAEFIASFAKRCEAVRFGGDRPSREELDNMSERLNNIVRQGTGGQ